MPWPIIALGILAAWLVISAVLLALVDACATIKRGLELNDLWRDEERE